MTGLRVEGVGCIVGTLQSTVAPAWLESGEAQVWLECDTRTHQQDISACLSDVLAIRSVTCD
jgi:hypothetical protein